MKKKKITALLILVFLIVVGLNIDAFLKHQSILNNLPEIFAIYPIIIILVILFLISLINISAKKRVANNSSGISRVNSIFLLFIVVFSFFIQPLKTYSLYLFWNVLTLSMLILVLVYFFKNKFM